MRCVATRMSMRIARSFSILKYTRNVVATRMSMRIARFCLPQLEGLPLRRNSHEYADCQDDLTAAQAFSSSRNSHEYADCQGDYGTKRKAKSVATRMSMRIARETSLPFDPFPLSQLA